MLAYIFRRLLLIIPTLFGILLINFIIIQAAPGGPVEQMIAKLEGFEGATSRIAGGGAEVSVAGSNYRGAQGLDPELVAEIERMYGFDKSPPERLWIMVKNYAQLDFGDMANAGSYFDKHSSDAEVAASRDSLCGSMFRTGNARRPRRRNQRRRWHYRSRRTR